MADAGRNGHIAFSPRLPIRFGVDNEEMFTSPAFALVQSFTPKGDLA